jgi:hypothetical protein
VANETPDLIVMACSAKKLAHAAPALDLYQGVMFSSFRANVQAGARPHVVILSALHGFVSADKVIEPYEQRLTPERAERMLTQTDEFIHEPWPRTVSRVLLAGGEEYRRVMWAAVQWQLERGHLAPTVRVGQTSGGIGVQRQQLGSFLRSLKPELEVVGHHPNGTPLYRALGGFTLEQSVEVRYPGRPESEAEPAVIAELFEGPGGPSANVRMLNSPNPHLAYNWVLLNHLRPRSAA